MGLGQQLRLSETFRLLDDGEGALCLMIIDPQGVMAAATNTACERQFRAAHELYSDYMVRRTSPILLSAAFIAPDDRPAWFRFQIEATFRDQCQARTILGKVRVCARVREKVSG